MFLATVVLVNYVPDVRVTERIARLGRAQQRVLRRRLAAHSSRSFQQLRALWVIDREDTRTQAALADRLMIDPPAASRLIDRLVEDGLVTRCAGDDRRCVRLEVTKSARAEIEAVDNDIEAIEGHVRSALTRRDVEQLERVLGKLESILDLDPP